jgi:hypothetical protein
VLAPPVIGRAHPGPGPTAAGPSRPTPAGPGRRRLTENEAEQIRQDRVALWGEAEQTRRFDRRDELANRIRPDVEARLNNVRIELQESIDERDFGKADRIEQDQVLPLQRERNAVDDELATVLGDPFGAVITVPTDLHATLNNDYAVTVAGGVDTDATSALTGTGGPPPVEQSRAYGEPGGHRQPLEYDQQVVEDLIPRDGDGRPQRLPNPFARWFAKMNDSGPGADPTRGINCVDCVLSLFDTWLHGRPRVAAPRTFDAYRDGDVRQPLYGELGGLTRARDVLGTDFTTTYLADTTGGLDPETVYTERIGELERALLDAGHGSFAMIANEWRDGGGHTWAAVNYQGQVVYLDPQHGIADYRPIHNTLGPHGLTRLDIAIVDGAGRPVGVTPDPLRSPWRGGDPTGHPTSDEPHMAGTPDAATDGSIAPVGLAPVGPDDPADPASRPLRQRMLDPYDGSADASAAYSDTPTSPPPAQPWDGWKEQEGAAWRDQSVAEVATGFDLAEDPGAVATLTEAYELTRDQIAPFVVQVAAEMLIDFRTAVAENPARKIVFVGRDGDSLALAIHQLDRDFFDAHCTQITLSRKLAMMAVLDAEAQRHRSLERDGIVASEDDVRIAPAGFRWDFRSEAPENTTDALADLEDYLESQGVPLDEGSAVTIVDSSFKGTVQEILNALFPRISFAGAYIWHGQSAGDPHPGSKTGYATSLADPRPPDAVDPKWETVTYEDTLRGPLASPSGFENGRPVQGPESGDNPTSGIHRRLIAERFRNAPGPVGPGTAPRARLRDAILAVNREAISDYARHIASESDPGAELFAGFQAYRRQTWRWMHLLMAHPPGVPDRYVTFLDSFVRGGAGGTHRRRSDAQPPPGSDQAAAAPTPQAMEEM